jgi:hypothetical protein
MYAMLKIIVGNNSYFRKGKVYSRTGHEGLEREKMYRYLFL